MHPADDIRGTKSSNLQKKTIILGVTGSIAAVETIRLAREMIRHGADVIPVMTPAATRIIHPYALWFATGHHPIIELTGKTEHVMFCGQKKDTADVVLISPCTANTLSKIAHGIDDTAVTTFATTAIGSGIPIILVPAMHGSMYAHKIVQQNITTCLQQGMHVVGPHFEENKAKMTSQEEIIAQVIRITGKKELENKNILIIGGATREPIDDIRVLTNRSTGKTALALAIRAFERGAKPTLWIGATMQPVPSYISTTSFTTSKDLLHLVNSLSASSYDAIIMCAAVADYLPKKQPGKIPSGKQHLDISCTPAPKILESIRKKAPRVPLIAFKAEPTSGTIKKQALQLLKKYHLTAVIGNTLSGFENDINTITIIQANQHIQQEKGTKNKLADTILNTLA